VEVVMATNRVGHTGSNAYPHDEMAHDSLTHPQKAAHLPKPSSEKQEEEGEAEDESDISRAARAKLFAVGSEISREVSRAERVSFQVFDRVAYTAGKAVSRTRTRTAKWMDKHPLRTVLTVTAAAFGIGFLWRIVRARYE
jgi:hypothetical protein